MRILSYRSALILGLLALAMTVVACSGGDAMARRNNAQVELAREAGVTPPAGGAAAPAAAPAGGAAGGAASGGDPVKLGQAAAGKYGCIACHSATGTAGVGPTWKGLAGSKVDLVSGGPVTADDAFLKESIEAPNAKIVKGFQPGIMPQDFAKQMKPDEIDQVIAYIKSLK